MNLHYTSGSLYNSRSTSLPMGVAKLPLELSYAGYFIRMPFVLIGPHSKWLEIKMVPTATTEKTITCLQTIAATHGLPEGVVLS